ncbi:MAG: HAD family hydrolase [Planctomycetota bacterium]
MSNPIERPHVLLFDIDGTLIDSGGAGGGALLKALQREFELDQVQPVGLHGRTDLGIFSELLENHGISPDAGNFERLKNQYLELLPSELLSRTAEVLPGVRELLNHLQSCEQVVSAILTGNLPGSAQLKLEHHGLWDFFEFGIYGDLAPHRPDLAVPAMDIVAKRVEAGVAGSDVTIIGDTPLDVELAKRMGARCLGVCTGGFEAVHLRDAGADHVVENMADVDAITGWLLPAPSVRTN